MRFVTSSLLKCAIAAMCGAFVLVGCGSKSVEVEAEPSTEQGKEMLQREQQQMQQMMQMQQQQQQQRQQDGQ